MDSWAVQQRAERDWEPEHRERGSRADRQLRTVEVAIPPWIGGLSYEPGGAEARAHDGALIAITRLDAGFGEQLAPRSSSPAPPRAAPTRR